MSTRGIFVCGSGAVTTAGTGVPALEAALQTRDWRPAVGLERPDAHPLAAVTCKDFSPKGVLPPLVARRLDRPARLLAVAARETLEALGAALPWDRDRIGVAAGTWNAGTSALVEVLRAVFLTSPEEAPPGEFPSTVANAAASQLGILEHFGGPNITFAEKQIGGLRAITAAARMLAGGRADAFLAGGVDEANWLNIEGYERLGSLRRPDRPGMLMGEGAAVLLLTATPCAAPLARLAGWGAAGAAAAPWAYPTSPDALECACRTALDRAGLRCTDLDLVVSASNGISALDDLEHTALLALLGQHRPAVFSMADRLGEGAFCAALRVLGAARVLAGHVLPTWAPPAQLAAHEFPALTSRPRSALVTGVAGGGSAMAAVLTAV